MEKNKGLTLPFIVLSSLVTISVIVSVKVIWSEKGENIYIHLCHLRPLHHQWTPELRGLRLEVEKLARDINNDSR